MLYFYSFLLYFTVFCHILSVIAMTLVRVYLYGITSVYFIKYADIYILIILVLLLLYDYYYDLFSVYFDDFIIFLSLFLIL